MARHKRRSNKTKVSGIGAVIVLILVFTAFVNSCGNKPKKNSKPVSATPENVETMVALIMSQTPTATITQIPTETPVPTNTATITATPIPSETPVSYDSAVWLPSVMENENTVYYPDGSSWTPGNPDPVYTENGTSYYADGSSWTPYTAVPNDYENDNSCHDPSCGCVIKGNINSEGEKIYHCPNSPSYDNTMINKPGEQYFCTEQEAIDANFRKPENAPPCGGY